MHKLIFNYECHNNYKHNTKATIIENYKGVQTIGISRTLLTLTCTYPQIVKAGMGQPNISRYTQILYIKSMYPHAYTFIVRCIYSGCQRSATHDTQPTTTQHRSTKEPTKLLTSMQSHTNTHTHIYTNGRSAKVTAVSRRSSVVSRMFYLPSSVLAECFNDFTIAKRAQLNSTQLNSVLHPVTHPNRWHNRLRKSRPLLAQHTAVAVVHFCAACHMKCWGFPYVIRTSVVSTPTHTHTHKHTRNVNVQTENKMKQTKQMRAKQARNPTRAGKSEAKSHAAANKQRKCR